MNEAEEMKYHLEVQAKEIAEMSAHTEPYKNKIAGLEITVLPKVYPGGIDSELIAEAIGVTSNKSVLEVGTGTGIVALVAAQRGATRVLAVDLNPEAVKNARLNASDLQQDVVEVREGSLFDSVGSETFDIIAMNPPYTGKKPKNKIEICFWDEDNQTTRDFFAHFHEYLNPGGKTYLAWADFSPIELLEELAKLHNVELKLVNSKSTNSGRATFLVYELSKC